MPFDDEMWATDKPQPAMLAGSEVAMPCFGHARFHDFSDCTRLVSCG